MIRSLFSLLGLLLVLGANSVWARVGMTEVAWNGMPSRPSAEWIELYNDSSTPVDLSQWRVFESSSVLVAELTGTIPASGYFILARGTPSEPDPLPGVSDQSVPFGGFGLNNSGEDLTLVRSDGVVEAEIAAARGWPAGAGEPGETMQWDGVTWVTAPATPKAGIVPIAAVEDLSTTTSREQVKGLVREVVAKVLELSLREAGRIERTLTAAGL